MHAAVALGPRGLGPDAAVLLVAEREPAAVGRPVTRDTLCPRP